MTNAEKLIDIASAEIGTAEDPSGSNFVKYNTAYYGREVKGNAYPWCMAFVWWCFKEAGLKKLFYNGSRTASCTTLMKWAKNNSRFVDTDYQIGDVIFYDWDSDKTDSEHTGIFTGEYDGAKLLVIEGNTNDCVAKKSRSASDIIGAYRPQWGDVEEETETAATEDTASVYTSTTIPTVKRGMTGKAVETLQIILNGYGYNLGEAGIDGEFGECTEEALKSYQSQHNLTADGICGKLTHASFWG